MVTIKSYSQLNQCQSFEPHEPHVIFVEYDMYLRLLYFSNIWIKILDGYQIVRVWRNQACDQPVSCPCGSGVFTQRSELSFSYLLSKVIFLILICYVFKHCLLILPLFVSICENWLPGLTYGAYLVLFLKPGATIVEPKKPWVSSGCSVLTLCMLGCVGLDRPPLGGPSRVFLEEKEVGFRGWHVGPGPPSP